MCNGHYVAWVLFGCVGIGNDPLCQRCVAAIVRHWFWSEMHGNWRWHPLPTMRDDHWMALVLFGNVLELGMPPPALQTMWGRHCEAWVLFINVWELAMTPLANDTWRPLNGISLTRKCVGIRNALPALPKMYDGHCAACVLFGSVWELTMIPVSNYMWRPLGNLGFIRECAGTGNAPLFQRCVTATTWYGFYS